MNSLKSTATWCKLLTTCSFSITARTSQPFNCASLYANIYQSQLRHVKRHTTVAAGWTPGRRRTPPRMASPWPKLEPGDRKTQFGAPDHFTTKRFHLEKETTSLIWWFIWWKIINSIIKPKQSQDMFGNCNTNKNLKGWHAEILLLNIDFGTIFFGLATKQIFCYRSPSFHLTPGTWSFGWQFVRWTFPERFGSFRPDPACDAASQTWSELKGDLFSGGFKRCSTTEPPHFLPWDQASTDFAANSSCTSSDQKDPKIWRHDASSLSRSWLPNLILLPWKPCLLQVQSRRHIRMGWQDMQPTHPCVAQSSPGPWNVSRPLAGRTSLWQFCHRWHLSGDALSTGKDRDAKPWKQWSKCLLHWSNPYNQ